MYRKLLLLMFVCTQLWAYASDTYTVKVGELVTVKIPSEWENRLWGINKTFHWNVKDQTALRNEDEAFNWVCLRGLREAPNQEVKLTVTYGNGYKYTYTATVNVVANGGSSSSETKYIEISPKSVVLEKGDTQTFDMQTNCVGGCGSYIDYDGSIIDAPAYKTDFDKITANKPGRTKFTIYVDDKEVNRRFSASADVTVRGLVIPSGKKEIKIDCSYPDDFGELAVECYGIKSSDLKWTVYDDNVTIYPEGNICRVTAKRKPRSSYAHAKVEDNKGHTAWYEVWVSKSLNVLSPQNPMLYEDAELNMTCELDGELIWESSDPTIVRVDNNGKITTISPGSAYIRVTGYKNNKKASDYASVTVVKKVDEEKRLKDVEFVDYYGGYHWLPLRSGGATYTSLIKMKPIPAEASMHPYITTDEEGSILRFNDSNGIDWTVSYSKSNGKYVLTYYDRLEGITKTANYEYHPQNEAGVPEIQYKEIGIGETVMVYPTGLTPNSLLNMSDIKVDDPSILTIQAGTSTTRFKATGLRKGVATVSFHDNFSNADGKYQITVKEPTTAIEDISNETINLISLNGSIILSEKCFVEIYNMSGTSVYRGNTDHVSNLTPGIYIVKTGCTVHKIAVK